MEQETTIPLREVSLGAIVLTPKEPRGLVIFVHGAGSNRLSPRNLSVAAALEEAGFSCLLFDLLTPEELEDSDMRLDLSLMAERLSEATTWASERGPGVGQPIGYFGASTGSAVAFKAVTAGQAHIRAIVSRGGRPDLVLGDLRKVRIPSLLIVGGEDYQTRQLNERAVERFHGPRDLRIVPDAGHLFEEPGAMEAVAGHAKEWFEEYLRGDTDK